MNYNFKGINDDSDTCECCGRTDLKRVVWLAPADADGADAADAIPHGTQCAARLMGYSNMTVSKLSRKFTELEDARIAEARQRIFDTKCKVWQNVYILADEDLAELSKTVGLVENRIAKMASLAQQRRIERYPETKW